jgi:cytochrome o ubiquinol oxidase subunit 1
MPLFTWSALAALILVLFAFPILTATLGMLTFDRLLGMHLFTPEAGGNPMLFINLIWSWGHPEVYILILPAFGIFSEVVSTFSKKRLFGYAAMVWAIGVITILSFLVWLHHFFTMGAGANVNAFFGIMTMLIAVPTGVKIFNWLFTMYRGEVTFSTPMLWFIGFVIAFTVGGMAGVLMSVPPVDFQAHNSLFLIAHFHSMVIPGVLFGFFAGLTYWFPKMFGFRLDERLGRYAFWYWLIGFHVAFLPLYALGLMGATRRLDHYDASTGWQPLFIVAAIGAALLLVGVGCQVLQLLVSWKRRAEYRDTTGDPWDGRTLEWATSSPPPFYNFAAIPHVHERDPFWAMKQRHERLLPAEEPIHMPKNTPHGFIIGVGSFFLAFGFVWYIWWLAILGASIVALSLFIRLADEEVEYTLSPDQLSNPRWGRS